MTTTPSPFHPSTRFHAIFLFLLGHPGANQQAIARGVWKYYIHPNVPSKLIDRMRPRLEPLGLRIAGKTGPGGGYTLTKIKDSHHGT